MAQLLEVSAYHVMMLDKSHRLKEEFHSGVVPLFYHYRPYLADRLLGHFLMICLGSLAMNSSSCELRNWDTSEA